MTEDEMVGWHHRLSGHELSNLWELVTDREVWHAAVHGVVKSWKETVTDFHYFGSKSTANGDCSHEIKRYLLLERKAMTNLDSVFKSTDITLQQRSLYSRL